MSIFYTSIRRYGDAVFHRGYRDGRPFFDTVRYQPTLYVPVNKETDFKAFYTGQNLAPIKYDSMREAFMAIEQYKNIENMDLHGMEKYEYQFLVEKYPDEVNYDFDTIKILYFDIEVGTDDAASGFPDVQSADQRITMISASCNNHYTVWGLKEYQNDRKDVTFIYCENEHKLLNKFLDYWMKLKPDVVTGWNTNTFDLPYLYNRMVIMLGEQNANQLSPFGVVKKKTTQIMKQEYQIIDIFGIELLDYLMLYKFFTFKRRESYKLDFIGHVELDLKKVNYDEQGNLFALYDNDFQTFVEYSIRDTEIVEKLEEKLGIIKLVANVAYTFHANFSDTMKQVRVWDAYVYWFLHKQGVVVPPMKQGEKTHKYEGAYVKPPIIGRHKWIVSYDYASLYPNLTRLLNISPETQRGRKYPGDVGGHLKKKYVVNDSDLSVAVNGTTYTKEFTGVFPQMISILYKERKKAKTLMIEAQKRAEESTDPEEKRMWKNKASLYHVTQLSRKVGLNSQYGFLGSEHARYYSTDMAEAITITGQFANRFVDQKINEYLNKVLKTDNKDYIPAGDTDSLYVCLNDLVEKYLPDEKDPHKIADFLDQVSSTKIQKVINDAIMEMSEYLNAYDPDSMSMDREVIGPTSIFLAKKRYAISVLDSEGVRYSKPKTKIMGLETAKSSTPAIVRDYMTQVVESVLNDTEDKTQKLIKKIRKDFMKQSVYDISFPRGVNGLTKYRDYNSIYTKGTPIHVRAALLFNHYIQKNDLQTKYELILESDKMRFVFLRMPNPVHENVFGFSSIFPKELGFDQFVDYEMMFQKTFEEPMKSIFDTIGWTMKRTKTIDSFFE